MRDVDQVGLVNFTFVERRSLQFAPLWVFSSLVGHTRDFNSMELDSLARCLDVAARTQRGRLGREVLASINADIDALLSDYAKDPRSIATGLYAVAELLNRVSPGEAQQFRGMLVDGFGAELALTMAPFGHAATPEDTDKLRLTAELLVPL